MVQANTSKWSWNSVLYLLMPLIFIQHLTALISNKPTIGLLLLLLTRAYRRDRPFVTVPLAHKAHHVGPVTAYKAIGGVSTKIELFEFFQL